MREVDIIDKPEAKTPTRQATELGVTTAVWGLWLYLLLPIINIVLWTAGLLTIETELFEKRGYMEFLLLIQNMGWIILVTFAVMRLWGIYNYYRFGRHDRRNKKMSDSVEKLCRFFELDINELDKLEHRKEIIWPHKSGDEPVDEWLADKAAHITRKQLEAEQGNVVMRFHDEHKGMPSISTSLFISISFVIVTAILLLYSVGGLQPKQIASSPLPVELNVPVDATTNVAPTSPDANAL